jgi:hypothetical protein
MKMDSWWTGARYSYDSYKGQALPFLCPHAVHVCSLIIENVSSSCKLPLPSLLWQSTGVDDNEPIYSPL